MDKAKQMYEKEFKPLYEKADLDRAFGVLSKNPEIERYFSAEERETMNSLRGLSNVLDEAEMQLSALMSGWENKN